MSLPLEILSAGIRQLPSDNIDLVDVVEVLWAVVLREYTGNDQVAFNRVVDGEEVASCVSLNLDQDELAASSSKFPSLASLIAARRDGAHNPFSSREAKDGASCDTTIWITGKKPGSKNTPPPSSSDGDIVVEVQLNALEGKPLAIFWYRFPQISDREAHNLASTLKQSIHCLPSAYHSDIRDLDLLSLENREDLRKWMRTRASPQDSTLSLLDILQRTAQTHANVRAVEASDGFWTYGELEDTCHELARHLCGVGVKSGDMVLLLREKSKWTIAGMIAILMAGAVCVPVDIHQPKEQVLRIIESTSARFVLTSEAMSLRRDAWNPATSLQEICVPISSSRSMQSSTVQLPTIGHDATAFVFLTSGSTGIPKGVVQGHQALALTAEQICRAMRMDSSTRIFQYSSYSFDVSVGDIFATFFAAGCLCVPSEEQRLDELTETINAMKATHICVTSTILAKLTPEDVPSLRQVTVGRESLTQEQLRAWCPRIATIYGTTESVIWDTYHADLTMEDSPTNIGCSMGPTTTWIVDPWSAAKLVPVGAIGELLVGGPLLSKGYLNDEDRTKASFLEKPSWLKEFLTEEEKGRLYRTGDLVRYNSDGTIQYFGRKDRQIKIDGQRIELEEVEHHVKKHLPRGIEIAAEVIVSRSSPSRPFLVMFVVPDPACGLFKDEVKSLRRTIQAEISQALPTYMCPSAYISLPMLPRLADGKVNRSQLRETGAMLSIEELTQPTHGHTKTNEAKMPPQIPLEKKISLENKLRELWATTLGLEPSAIRAKDSFLQLEGGDSISVMQLVRLAQKHSMWFSVADVFSHPKLCDLATKVVFGEKPQEPILSFSLWRGPWTIDRLRGEASARCDVSPDQIEDIFPCTALQEGLLALTSRESNLYASREAFELHEHIDVSLVQEAWDTVAASMPILRTRVIDLHPHGLHQVIVNERIPWNTLETRPQFALGSRLVHWALIENEHSKQLVWTIHHSLYDRWSMPRILEQVKQAYYQQPLHQYLSMQPFIRYLSTVKESASRNFWNAQLFEAPPPSFPTLPSGSYEAKATESCTCYLPDFEWPAGIDVTPSVWIRAAWALLIGHITNTDDISFGATVSGRQLPVAGIQDIVGPTIATVPIRVQINWAASIRDFARQLQQQATDMIPFEQVGMHRLRHMSEDAKQGSQFRTLLNVQSAQSKPDTTRVWTRKVNEPRGQFNNFALILDCELRTSGVFVRLDFDKEIMQPRQVERLVHQLESILLQLGQKSLDLTKPLVDFNPINNHDLSEIWQWNAVVPEEIPVCLHDTIHGHVQQRPNAPAVDAWDGQLTYGALDLHSTNLASYLQYEYEHQVGPGIVIALCFEKSMWAVVAALAVMKTGSAFTLMDTSQPEERLQTIASQVNQDIIISSAPNASLATRLAKHVVVVDHANLLRLPPPRSLRVHALPASDLYIVFTSGSTGTPKGAIITHSNFSSAVKHQGAFMGYNPQTRVYDFASYSFDIAVSNLLHSLAAGGCLCIPSDAERKHSQLAESMNRMQVNLIDLTPSVTRTLDPTGIPSLKTLILGGEAASRSDILRWAPYLRVLNGIGQAECTVTTTMSEMDPTVPGTPGIGKALGTNTWIVNPTDHHQLAAIGAVGELLVEGPLVGAGYLNDEEKTLAAFIQDPRWLSYTPGPGGKARRGRLYKTGDLVRYNADGGLHFVGRKDAQVKIRGQRIELEEVEYHVQRLLLSLSIGASAAAEVLVLSGTSIRSAVLVVFVCPANMAGSDEGPNDGFRALDPSSFPPHYRQELNARLENELPSAMVPFVYVPVNRIPLSPTGKTDRKKLKALGASLTVEDLAKLRGFENKPKRPPSTSTERQVRDLWAEILATPADNIGIDDNFVQLGGDSISAMRLISLAKNRGLLLDSRNLFLPTSTLSDLALAASRAPTTPILENHQLPFSQLHTDDINNFLKVHIAPHMNYPMSDIVDVFPVTDYQAYCIKSAVQQKPPSSLNYIYIDFCLSDVSIEILSAACQAIAMHFPILRTVFVPFESSFLQVVTKDWVPDFVQFNSTSESMLVVSERIAREDWQNAECEIGTRFARFMVIRTDEEPKKARLLIRMSHSLYDGISLGLLLQAISAAIEKRKLPLIGSFASFIQHSTSIRNEASQYWTKLLSGSSMTRFSTARRTDDVSRSTLYTIQKTVNWPTSLPNGITAATFCTACWAAVVASTTQQADVVFGRLVSGRGATLGVIAEPIAGSCVNVVPLRVTWPRPSPNQRASFSPHEVFATIQQQQLDGMPFESTGMSYITTSSCTDWPADTACDSVFQYQNIDEAPEDTVAGKKVSLDVIPMEYRPEQILVLVKQPNGGSIEVLLFGTEGFMKREDAEVLGERFCTLVGKGGVVGDL